MKPSKSILASTPALVTAAVVAGFSGPVASQVEVEALAPNAPMVYILRKEDTLLTVAKRYLKVPARWRELFAEPAAASQLQPGTAIHLVVRGTSAKLVQSSLEEAVLQPRIRTSDSAVASSGSEASLESLRHFAKWPLLIDTQTFLSAPSVLSIEGGRLHAGSGHKVQVTGIGEEPGPFAIYRMGRVLRDPDNAVEVGVEAIYIGTARLVSPDARTELEILQSNREVAEGDRLISVTGKPLALGPVAAAPLGVSARVLRVFDGETSPERHHEQKSSAYDREGGHLSIIALNKGWSFGLERGHLVDLVSVRRPARGGRPTYSRNDLNGSAIIVQAYRNVSYALVTRAHRPVVSGDHVQAPRPTR